MFTRALISANHISQAKKMRQHERLKVIPHLLWWGMTSRAARSEDSSEQGGLSSREIHSHLYRSDNAKSALESRERPSASCSDCAGMVLGGGLFPTKLNRNRALAFYSSLAPQTFIRNRTGSPVININVIKLSTGQEKLSSLGVNLPIHFWKFFLLRKHRMFSNLKPRPFPSPWRRQPGWPLFLLSSLAGDSVPLSQTVPKVAP